MRFGIELSGKLLSGATCAGASRIAGLGHEAVNHAMKRHAIVEALKLNDYPEPERRPLGPDDAASILLDPSKTIADFGEIEFAPLKETVAAAVAYYETYGVQGGYTHLKHSESE